MKLFPIFVALLIASMTTNAQSWQDVSATLFTNTEIIWQVPSNALPKTLWVYRRVLPHVFPASVISNAIVMGSLEKRGFPHPSTNDFYISPEVPPNWPGTIPTLFGMLPKDANLYFYAANFTQVLPKDIPDDETIKALAHSYAPRLGIAPAELIHEKFYMHHSDDEAGTNIYGRGVFFPRQLDGIDFFSADNSGDGAEGFSFELGGRKKIQAFSVRWSEMQRNKNERVASLGEITRCMVANKAIVMPNFKDNDFAWLKNLVNAHMLVITNITAYYDEGVFGEVPTNDVPCPYATPFAELDAVADVAGNHVPVKLLSPILSVEIDRLLKP